MRLREIPVERYAKEVLPLTAPLWAGRRNFDEYVAQTAELARSAYGRRYYRTMGLYDGKALVASFKRYERELHLDSQRLQAIGFGAVFTPPEYRGRGYASVMMASELDRARKEGYDVAYLFSDIRPQFYIALGFRELRSREFALKAAALPAARIAPSQLSAADWTGVRRCFSSCEERREAGFVRGAAVWGWLRMRIAHNSEHSVGDAFNLVVRRGRGVRAYVLGARAPERDAYVLDEYGFSDDRAAALIPALVRAAAGDLRRIVGWAPPSGLELLPKGTTRKRRHSILMMAPLSDLGERLVARLTGEPAWATDHI